MFLGSCQWFLDLENCSGTVQKPAGLESISEKALSDVDIVTLL